MKTITITDDVYEELRRIKGRKSFSKVIKELLKKSRRGNEWIDEVFGSIKDIDVDAVREARKSWKTRTY